MIGITKSGFDSFAIWCFRVMLADAEELKEVLTKEKPVSKALETRVQYLSLSLSDSRCVLLATAGREYLLSFIGNRLKGYPTTIEVRNLCQFVPQHWH